MTVLNLNWCSSLYENAQIRLAETGIMEQECRSCRSDGATLYQRQRTKIWDSDKERRRSLSHLKEICCLEFNSSEFEEMRESEQEILFAFCVAWCEVEAYLSSTTERQPRRDLASMAFPKRLFSCESKQSSQTRSKPSSTCCGVGRGGSGATS